MKKQLNIHWKFIFSQGLYWTAFCQTRAVHADGEVGSEVPHGVHWGGGGRTYSVCVDTRQAYQHQVH